MQLASMRSLIGIIGLVASVATALAIVAGYAVIRYRGEADRLAVLARLDAANAGHVVAALREFPRDSGGGIPETIDVPGESGIRLRVFDAGGASILERGDLPAWPTLAREAPISAADAGAGRIEATISLRPLLAEIAIAAGFSLVAGFGLYLAIRVLPLRIIDRVLRELKTQNARFNTALNNMSHGLCFFDGAQRLIVCNSQYIEIYGLSPDHVRPGATLQEIVDLRVEAGSFPPMSRDEYLGWRRHIAESASPSDSIVELRNGRIIEIHHRPMPDGGWVATHEDITERRRAEQSVAHMARHDAVTDLPNRVLLREYMEDVLARARGGEAAAVLCLDLDHFKNVNDTLGHPVGDALLRAVAERLRACTTPHDMVARLGGDEFAIIQTAAGQPHAAGALAAHVVETLGAPFDLAGHQVTIGTSVGIAVAPRDGVDPDILLKAADMALYRAKTEGRGVFRFFEPELSERVQRRHRLQTDIRKALANGEMTVFYQPFVNIADGRPVGCEALLRWRHPERGMIPAAEFISLAEEIGLISSLGEWALRTACAQAAGWPGDMKVAVNLSPKQFKDEKLIETIVNALARSGLAPHRLELEITETLLLEESVSTRETLHQLRALGVRISLDDFGVGYSSLSYLRSFPFDKIKIDKSFVNDLVAKPDCRAIIRAVTDLGLRLGMVTTAEGVETEEQIAILQAVGCTEAQGYYFSPPRAADELGHLLIGRDRRIEPAA